MELGNYLVNARKKNGFSQEKAAEKLNVSQNIISKWENNEAVPDIQELKKIARLYHISLDHLVGLEERNIEIQEIIDNTSEKEEKINWTNAWGKKYPILLKYQTEVEIENYAYQLNEMLESLKDTYKLSELDAMLVLKDILYQVWKKRKNHR